MGKIVVKNAVERKQGFLYYIDGKGNLCEAKMSRTGAKKKPKKAMKKVTKKPEKKIAKNPKQGEPNEK